MVAAADIQRPAEVRDANRARNRRNLPDECFVCGRAMATDAIERGSSIHLLTDGTLAAVGDFDNPLSQGWFPVGSECAKRVPAEVRWT